MYILEQKQMMVLKLSVSMIQTIHVLVYTISDVDNSHNIHVDDQMDSFILVGADDT